MCLSNLVSYVCIIDWFKLYAQFQWKMNSCMLCFPVIIRWIWWYIACLSKHLPLPGLIANGVIFLPWMLMPTSCMMILNLMLKNKNMILLCKTCFEKLIEIWSDQLYIALNIVFYWLWWVIEIVMHHSDVSVLIIFSYPLFFWAFSLSWIQIWILEYLIFNILSCFTWIWVRCTFLHMLFHF